MKKLYFLILVLLGSHSLFAQTIRYVKQVATGTEDGSTWANASGDLQAMINASAAGDEVWVASGIYKPTEKLQAITYVASPGTGVATTDRDMAFIMKDGVKVYGGYNGDTGIRDVLANVSILSGDLNNDNTASDGDCYHVVSSRNNVNDAVLDGFTIQHGYANGSASVSGSGTTGTSNLTIAQFNGGAIALRGADNAMTFSNLIIRDNYASDYAGGLALYISGTRIFTFNNIVFINNESGAEAGAARIYSSSGTPTVNISNSKFISNKAASRGGAIYAFGSTTSGYLLTVNVSNTLFFDNISASSTLGGGAISPAGGTNFNVLSSTFYANKATNAAGVGGAIHISSSASAQLTINNTIFNENTALGSSASSPDIFKGTVAPNPIINNTLTQAYGVNGVNGNIVNPAPAQLFASTTSTDLNFLHLIEGAATQKGDNSLIPSGVTTDLAGQPRITHGTVDLGAYEYQGTLPVSLISYTAAKKGSTSVLTWKTESEQNNQKFVIERGSSATNFTFFKEVAGAGNSSAPLSYTVTDFTPLAGNNYYRLTQYDNDGTLKILGVEAVKFELTAQKTSVYPNPASSYVKVNSNAAEGIVSLNLISLTGKTILTNNYAQLANESVKLELANIPTGTYILWINKGKPNAEKQTLLVVK